MTTQSHLYKDATMNYPKGCEVRPVTYRVRFNARLKGALGVTQDCDFTLRALSEHAARMRIYDVYEHVSALVITEVM